MKNDVCNLLEVDQVYNLLLWDMPNIEDIRVCTCGITVSGVDCLE